MSPASYRAAPPRVGKQNSTWSCRGVFRGVDGRKGGLLVIAVMTTPRDDEDMPKLVLMPVFDGLQTLDLTGPLEVFTGASRYLGSNHYEVVTASVGGGP